MKTYDAIVIGGGPGGYPCSIKLGQLGLKVVCVEKEKPGGVCLNWGCIPSKALIQAANTYERTKDGAAIGVKVSGIELDPNAMQDWKEGIVKKLNDGVRGLLKGNGADYLEGTAKLVSKDTVEVTLKDGSKETLKSTKGIVLATGASTVEIPTFKFDGQQIIGAKEAVNLRTIPKRLLVIGGGVIGLELGTVYQKLGSELFVAEAQANLLATHDQDCVKLVERKLVKHGAKIFKKALAKGYEKNADGSLKVTLEQDGKAITLDVDVVLVAVGMRPNSANLGLEAVGVKVERGFVPTDSQGRTNVAGIYAVGDVSGAPLLAHKASKEGEVVAEVIAGHAAAKDWVAIPASTFTDPEISSVGITEDEAKAKGQKVIVGKFPFAALAKAMAMRETDGFVKVVADADSKQILGVHIVGPEASALISEGALAIEMAAFVDDVMLTVHPHPTLGEAFMEAAAASVGQAVHIVNR
ncbi:MAG: dihydrolipoyl dehydrogenase [Deltaproteobacteria bacterium]|nr:dihydrolipoyl dehydrogenase [Deltaproteobacteria bacterium]